MFLESAISLHLLKSTVNLFLIIKVLFVLIHLFWLNDETALKLNVTSTECFIRLFCIHTYVLFVKVHLFTLL